MRLAMAVGVAVAGLAFSALAHEFPNVDANEDGWVTRAEASALADRVFRDLDSNHDNKLDDSDRANDQVFAFRSDDGAEVREHIERRIERSGDTADRHEDVRRHVIIRRDDGTQEEFDMDAPEAPEPPEPPEFTMMLAPHPPGPPMFMMLFANNEEADANGDGALSLEEFRAQHLRFFDASDANGDGRVRMSRPPVPPEPPVAPAPPAPPRTHR